MRTWIKTIVDKCAFPNHKALTLGVHALRSYLKLICEYELHSFRNKKVSGAKDHGKNYIKVRPPLVRHLLRYRQKNRRYPDGSNFLVSSFWKFYGFTQDGIKILRTTQTFRDVANFLMYITANVDLKIELFLLQWIDL